MSRGAPFDPRLAQEALARVGASLAAEELASRRAEPCLRFAERTWVWNRRTNLSGAKTIPEMIDLLFADAFALAPWVEQGARVIDVGSGGGAPGLSLLLLRPDLSGLLVEPRAKRAAFLRTSLASLGLKERARLWEGRIEPEEPLPEATAGSFELALSRATFPPPTWLSLGLRLAPEVALFGAGELPAPAEGCARRTRRYSLPENGAERLLGLYQRNPS